MKKIIKLLPILVFAVLLSSCSSVRVASDYDKETEFKDYKTFAFFKPGIDKAEISDLDKRRILKAIEAELVEKGMTKSTNPDMLISIFTKSNQRVDVFNNNWGWGGFGGWGWGGFGWGGNQVSTRTEGILFIDFIDAEKKQLIWQGSGTGYLATRNRQRKIERINEFVNEMMTAYPPEQETK